MERPGNARLRAMLAAMMLAAAPSVSGAEAPPVEQLRQELESMRKQLQQMQKKIDAQDEVIRKLSKEPAAAPATAATPPPPSEAPPVVAKAPEPWSPTAPMRILSGSRGYLNLS